MSALGGPGVACSTMTLRRLEAGELSGDQRARAEAHLAGCARCQAAARALEAERRVLATELPFEAFAAGVAERLADPAARRPAASARPAWRRLARLAPLALAAGLALAVGLPLLGKLVREGPLAPSDGGVRSKGGAAAVLFVALPSAGAAGPGAPATGRRLAPAEPIPDGAALRLVLSGVGRRQALAVLVDEDGPALLPASEGAFEWTGRAGRLLVVLDDGPIDAQVVLARLRAGAAPVDSATAEVLSLPLERAAGAGR